MFIPLHDLNPIRPIRLQYATLALIGLNVATFLAVGAYARGDESVAKAIFFSFGYVPAVAGGLKSLPPELSRLPEWTDYATYAFLHADLWHLAGNMLFVWVFGDNVEDALGHVRFVLFFLLCAAAGAFAHSIAQPLSESPLVGASGAAAGIVAAYLLLHPHVKLWVLAFGKIPMRISALWVLGLWILFQAASLFLLPEDRVSWAAHLGGILAGLVLLPIMKRRDVPLFSDTLDVARGRAPAAPPAAPPAPAASGEPAIRSPWGRQKDS
jgi:membrane associated rhomboid family serine protease